MKFLSNSQGPLFTSSPHRQTHTAPPPSTALLFPLPRLSTSYMVPGANERRKEEGFLLYIRTIPLSLLLPNGRPLRPNKTKGRLSSLIASDCVVGHWKFHCSVKISMNSSADRLHLENYKAFRPSNLLFGWTDMCMGHLTMMMTDEVYLASLRSRRRRRPVNQALTYNKYFITTGANSIPISRGEPGTHRANKLDEF